MYWTPCLIFGLYSMVNFIIAYDIFITSFSVINHPHFKITVWLWSRRSNAISRVNWVNRRQSKSIRSFFCQALSEKNYFSQDVFISYVIHSDKIERYLWLWDALFSFVVFYVIVGGDSFLVNAYHITPILCVCLSKKYTITWFLWTTSINVLSHDALSVIENWILNGFLLLFLCFFPVPHVYVFLVDSFWHLPNIQRHF